MIFYNIPLRKLLAISTAFLRLSVTEYPFNKKRFTAKANLFYSTHKRTSEYDPAK